MHAFKRKVPSFLVAAGFAGGAAIGVASQKNLFNLDDNVNLYATSKPTDAFLSNGVAALPPHSMLESDEHGWKWDKNWDWRDPHSLLMTKKEYVEANDEQRKKMLVEAKPKVTRNIILIRHGQYMLNSETKQLTPLGREQADLLGNRLAKFQAIFEFKYDECHISTMQRAKETAQIMLQHLPHIDQDEGLKKESNILEEGAPCRPQPPFRDWRPEYWFYQDGARIEAAFRRHFHRASTKQKEDSYELIVCHANVIRYFVCRALQFPPEGWLRMSLANASITWLQIRPNGHVTLKALGDFGHLMPDKVTFT